MTWFIATPARKGWVATYGHTRDLDDSVWGTTRPLAGWSDDGTALVVDRSGQAIPASEYRPGTPAGWDRTAFVSVGTDDADREVGTVPGQGWTLRDEAGHVYPVIAFTVGRHGARPVCVMDAEHARVYTPENWRDMALIAPSTGQEGTR